jgi:iron complex outermembrane receptor protein
MSVSKMIAAASTLLATLSAFAQTEQQNGEQLQEVVVTAEKRGESLVNVPIAVTAVSSESLAKAGVTAMSDLPTVVPGLHIDSSGAFFQPSIRGVGTALAGIGVSSNVATYVDGIYQPGELTTDFNFIDVNSVQVLKGPQGTLFGRNTTGGAILVTTKAPSFTPQLQARAGYGSFNTAKWSLFASDGLIDDKLAASVAFGGSHSDGWLTNVATGRDGNPAQDWMLRARLLFLPSENLRVTFTANGGRVDDPSLYAVSVYRGQSDAALFGVPLSVGQQRSVSLEGGSYAHVQKSGGADLKLEYDLGFANLTSYTAIQYTSGHEETNESASAFPTPGTPPLATAGLATFFETADWLQHTRTFSQELNFGQSGHGPIDWMTGLYYFADKQVASPFNIGLYGPFGPGGLLSGAPFPWPAAAYLSTGNFRYSDLGALAFTTAAFGDLTYNWTDWHFTVGARGTADRAGVEYSNPASIGSAFTAFPYTTASKKFYSFTPRTVVRYSLTDSSNIYASWSTATKSGLYNSTGFPNQQTPVSPEKIRAVEIGYKLASVGWQLETSTFYYDYSNLQVATYRGAVALFQNAASSRIYGGDFHVRHQLARGLRLDLAAAYTHARYTTFPNAATSTFSPILGVENGVEDVSGRNMERTPSFSGSGSLDYAVPAFGGELDLSGTYAYQTASSFDFGNQLVQGSYGLLNLRAGWTDPSGQWNVAVSGRNVTNKTYLVQIFPSGAAFGAVYGEPANVMFEVNYSLR